MMNKTKILSWVVVLLVIMNAVTIVTILYHNNQVNKQRDNIVIQTGSNSNWLNGRFFRHTLGFNNEQMNVFRNVNQHFRPVTAEITAHIGSLKNEMFVELNQPDPDTMKLTAMSKEIGDLHGHLKYETYTFYLSIKTICSAEQQAGLVKAFQPLFINEAMPAHAPRQRGKGINRD
jgi:hypothetical protein